MRRRRLPLFFRVAGHDRKGKRFSSRRRVRRRDDRSRGLGGFSSNIADDSVGLLLFLLAAGLRGVRHHEFVNLAHGRSTYVRLFPGPSCLDEQFCARTCWHSATCCWHAPNHLAPALYGRDHLVRCWPLSADLFSRLLRRSGKRRPGAALRLVDVPVQIIPACSISPLVVVPGVAVRGGPALSRR